MLFDGTCKLCNGWARFVIARDHRHRIRLATAQSAHGQALLGWAGLPQSDFKTIVLITDDQVYIRSQAMFEIFARLSWAWRWLALGRVIPAALRDWVYDRIAQNRYRWFGRYDASRTPAPDHPERFLRV